MKLSRKHILIFALMILGSSSAVFARKDAKARQILDAVYETYSKSAPAGDSNGGIEITFGGTTPGTLLLKGDMFVLDCGGVKSWFDGKTQWSYVEANEEVNISCPTPEELQTVNPYALLGMYKKGFDYEYVGKKNRNGSSCDEVVLTPENNVTSKAGNGNSNPQLKSITVLVNSKMHPVYIEIVTTQGDSQIISVNRYSEKTNLSSKDFKFDSSKYPNAEIIDLR